MKQSLSSFLLVFLLFLMIIPPPIYAITTVKMQSHDSVMCPPQGLMALLTTEYGLVKGGKYSKIELVPLENFGKVYLKISQHDGSNIAILDIKPLPEDGKEVILSAIGSDGSILIAMVRRCGNSYYYSSFESVIRSRDVRA